MPTRGTPRLALAPCSCAHAGARVGGSVLAAPRMLAHCAAAPHLHIQCRGMTSFFEGEGEGMLRARAAEVGEAAALRGVSVAVGPAKPSNEGFGGCGGSRGGWSVERRGCGGLEALAGIGWLGWDGRDASKAVAPE